MSVSATSSFPAKLLRRARHGLGRVWHHVRGQSNGWNGSPNCIGDPVPVRTPGAAVTSCVKPNVLEIPFDEMVREMELLKGVVLGVNRLLAPFNGHDRYFRELVELGIRDYFFETYLVIAWAGLRLDPRRILEIGTRNGGSLTQLLHLLDLNVEREVVCFDLWREIGGPKSVKKNLERLLIPARYVQFISGDSRQTVPQFLSKRPPGSFDYVLVDGGHEREVATADLRNVADCVAPGGILIFDDIGPESHGLVDVWEAFQKEQGDRFVYYQKLHRKGVGWAFRRN
jgi:predicted O-methyltransferase YrrM